MGTRVCNRAVLASCFLGMAIQGNVGAQERRQLSPNYPTKPVRVMVTVAPGGGLDIITRGVAAKLAERMAVAVIVDNVSGANGVIAVNAAIASAPDGHTLLSVGGSLPINTVFGKFALDVRSGLTPVAQMSSQPYMMFLPASLPLDSFKDVMAHARANPGKLSYGSSGVGSVVHMGMELMGFMSGVRMVHVPYKGNGPANVDLAAGRLDILLGSISGIQLVRTGKAKLVAVTSPQRLPDYPDIPTVAESGLGGYELSNTYTLYAPARTPGVIVSALNLQVIQSLGDQELRRKMVADASTPAPPRSPNELRKILVAEIERWESLVKKVGITLDY